MSWHIRARFPSLARSKLRLCTANHRAGYFSNLACDWLSIVWAYSEQETENGPSCSFRYVKLEAYWFSATSLSKWPPGGHIGHFGFQTNFTLALNIDSKLKWHNTYVCVGAYWFSAMLISKWPPYWIFWFRDSNFSLALNINSKLKWDPNNLLSNSFSAFSTKFCSIIIPPNFICKNSTLAQKWHLSKLGSKSHYLSQCGRF